MEINVKRRTNLTATEEDFFDIDGKHDSPKKN